MQRTTLLRISALSLLLGFTAYSAPAGQDPDQQAGVDPVADAARKARAEQKKEAKPKKVFTNEDFPSATPAPPPGTTATTPDGTTTKDGTPKKVGPPSDTNSETNSEAVWRGRFKDLRDRISTAEKELDVLQRELNKDDVQYYPDPQEALKQQHDRSDINDKTAKIDDKKKEIATLKNQLSDLEDKLRKSGGDPGWAR
jgi:DNA repair exonuclease SbcCD ATPase subunit